MFMQFIEHFFIIGEMMHEALLVNPYDLDDAAEVLNRALCMPADEREVRMSYLRKREKTYNVSYWMRSFLKVEKMEQKL